MTKVVIDLEAGLYTVDGGPPQSLLSNTASLQVSETCTIMHGASIVSYPFVLMHPKCLKDLLREAEKKTYYQVPYLKKKKGRK